MMNKSFKTNQARKILGKRRMVDMMKRHARMSCHIMYTPKRDGSIEYFKG